MTRVQTQASRRLSIPDADVLDVARLDSRIRACRAAPARWAGADIEWLELSSTFVRFRKTGQGDTAVVIALDPPNVIEQCDPIVDLLKGDFQVIVYEQPGFGFSFPKPGFRFSMDDYAAFLEELLKAVGVRQCFLSFPCVSTFYGIKVAARRPDLVERALFMQATGWPDQRKWGHVVADAFTLLNLGIPVGGRYVMRAPYLGQALGLVIEKNFARRTQPFVVYGGRKDRAKAAAFVDPAQRVTANGGCNLMETFYQRFLQAPDFTSTPVEQPVHLAWATADRSHRRSNRRGLLPLFRDATYSEHARCGHHFDVEKPELVASLLRELAAR